MKAITWYKRASEMGFGMQTGTFNATGKSDGITPITSVPTPPSPQATAKPSAKPSEPTLVAEVPKQPSKQTSQSQVQMAEMMRESLKVGLNTIIQTLPSKGLISPQQAQAITNLLSSPDMEVQLGMIAEQSMSGLTS
jgi:hypothetical protein